MMKREMKNRSLKVHKFKKLVARYSLLVIFLLFTIHYSLSTAWADDEVLRIQKAYKNIKDIKGSFIQKSYIKGLKRTDTYKGQFFIKSPKMKWHYKGDKPHTIYIIGEDIIIYQINEKQAFKAKFDRSTYGQAPIALLSGFGNIRNEFDVSIKKENELLLKPKKPLGNILHIELKISDNEFPIESLSIVDALSNRIDIYLTDVKINTNLKDKIFEFSPPKGVNIFQQ